MKKDEAKRPKVLLKTFGCAMNFYDSEAAEGILEKSGYQVIRTGAEDSKTESKGAVDHIGKIVGKADVILMNTCSVREHAEDRIYGRLGMLGKAKRSQPDLIVGLMGCMVEEHREALFERFPQLDFMVGTRNLKDLPKLIEEVRARRVQVARIRQEGISIEYSDRIVRRGGFHAWLPIMTGCNKVCTFCIVPKTRGPEVSIPVREVCREAERLAAEGIRWVTLLGQNVNSYPGFPQLLEMLCGVGGLARVSFTTSHPQDATRELFEAIARNPKVSRRFHLPLQSGSDRVLKRMKRLHTFAEFREKVDWLRRLVPGISMTTDIIAGFPGEREEDHEATARALEEIRFDGAYIYKYSVRPGTPASKFTDDVPLPLKERRNAGLLDIQRRISREISKPFVGQALEVFVEGFSTKGSARLVGRSHAEKRVLFPGEAALIGSFQRVKIEQLVHDTFVGSLEER